MVSLIHPEIYDRRGISIWIVINKSSSDIAPCQIGNEWNGTRNCHCDTFNIDTPFKTIRCLCRNSKSLWSPPDGHRIKESALQQDILCPCKNLRIEPPHDPCQGHCALSIAYHKCFGIQIMTNSVKRSKMLSFFCPPYYNPILSEPIVIKGMKRLAHFQHHIVGHIHDVIDIPYPWWIKPVSHPEWSRA